MNPVALADAEAEIVRLRERLQAHKDTIAFYIKRGVSLEAALRPFANEIEFLEEQGEWDDDAIGRPLSATKSATRLLLVNLLDARAALTPQEPWLGYWCLKCRRAHIYTPQGYVIPSSCAQVKYPPVEQPEKKGS